MRDGLTGRGSPPAGALDSAARRDPAAILSWRRALIAVGLGCLAGGVAAVVGPLELIPIVAWVVADLVVLTGVWRIIWPQDAAGTERLADCESQLRTTDTAVLTAAVVSLGAVVLAVVQSSSATNAGAVAAVLLSLAGAILSWCLVNTVFALKYARLYYLDEDGGVDFKQPDPPAYSDFAYVAFTVGMTFGTPETEITNSQIRKVVLGHALLSYIFATGVLAVAVNVVTNLGQ
jgi:uncharacterized membrane protein